MSKEPFANYASYVFIQYARLGRPTGEDIMNRLSDQVNIKYSGKSRLERKAILGREIEANKGLIFDMEAVSLTLDMLSGKAQIPSTFKTKHVDKGAVNVVDVLEAIYFNNCRSGISAKGLTLRVRRFACQLPCDERTVWRCLSYAKRLFAENRGLSLSWHDDVKIQEENEEV